MERGIGLPTAGPDASPDRIAHAAEEAERLGLGAVWTFERLLYPEEPMMLGVGPMRGRAFTEDDAAPGAEDVGIISYATWRSDFGGDDFR